MGLKEFLNYLRGSDGQPIKLNDEQMKFVSFIEWMESNHGSIMFQSDDPRLMKAYIEEKYAEYEEYLKTQEGK